MKIHLIVPERYALGFKKKLHVVSISQFNNEIPARSSFCLIMSKKIWISTVFSLDRQKLQQVGQKIWNIYK